ncbi:hypothetical protein Scep_002609 [Stephania cephalantha]|uniref:Uncharacterized protein n=1 Tax=Stephania cephalantha TaxID=152367 RepID=A0AAP0LBJ0_9MAGN
MIRAPNKKFCGNLFWKEISKMPSQTQQFTHDPKTILSRSPHLHTSPPNFVKCNQSLVWCDRFSIQGGCGHCFIRFGVFTSRLTCSGRRE